MLAFAAAGRRGGKEDNVADSENLETQAREALLKAIANKASAANCTQLEQLANAFAMTVGANRGRLPGYRPSSS